MKYFKILIPAFLLVFLTGCLKTHQGFTDFSTTSDFVVLQNAGMANFNSVAFNRGSDTINLTVRVDLASATNPSSTTAVTVAIDPSLITAYNSSNPQPGYVLPPAANYKLLATSLTIPAGQHYAETTLQVYTQGLDPAASYMVPVTVKDASGKNLSSNLNAIYFHTIGNPLAGVYTWLGKRWNEASGLDTTQAPASIPYNNVSTAIAPLGPHTLSFPNTYLNQNGVPATMALDFTNTSGVLSNFSVSINDPQGGIAAVGFSIVSGPFLVGYNIVGNGSTKYVGSTFRFYTVFSNGSAKRATIDNFTKTQ